MNLFDALRHLESSSEPSALCTVVAFSGSTPRKIGAKMIVKNDGSERGAIVGTIGGGAIEHHIRGLALEAIEKQEPRLVATSLRNELGMCCGGEMTVFIEPLLKTLHLVCFGAGHIAQSLVPLAHSLGFKVSVVDARPELLNLSVFSNASFRGLDPSIFGIQALKLSPETFVVVLTHDHQLDQQIVEHVLKYPVKYLGLVGSQRKALMTAKRLLAKNFSSDTIGRLFCPAGLDIKAQTPIEIALSIMAQITRIKNGSAENHSLDRSGRTEPTHEISESAPCHQR